jgi:Tat protein secretion system quality control protein TatD with DNase activity
MADNLPRLQLEEVPAPQRLIDTHAHVHFPTYAGQVDAVLHAATEAGVGTVISVGVTTADSRRAVEMASTYQSDSLEEAVRMIPGHRLLLETDCPFLSPVPHRGKRNEPARVKEICRYVAQLRREPEAHLARATTANAGGLFGLERR